MSGVDESAGMAEAERELAEQLAEQAGAQSELEHGDVDVPLEADDPELEHHHPGAERGEDDFR